MKEIFVKQPTNKSIKLNGKEIIKRIATKMQFRTINVENSTISQRH